MLKKGDSGDCKEGVEMEKKETGDGKVVGGSEQRDEYRIS